MGGSDLDPASRLLAVGGFRNLRDIGGLPVAGGGTVRPGLVYRGEAPSDLSPEQLSELGELGLRTAVDLRAEGQEDVFVAPTLPPGVRRLEAGVVPPADPSGKGLLQQVDDGELLDYSAADLGAMYVEFLRANAPAFGLAVGYLAEPDNLPTLVHCHAGKDRTGLVIAMVLDLVGVSRELILEDYELTTHARAYRRAEVERTMHSHGTDWERLSPLFIAPAETLEVALAHLEDEHGGVGGFLSGPGGLDRATLERLTALLVADAA
jgi:protein-tyrosine phosphatase